jgi:hypothetical protein
MKPKLLDWLALAGSLAFTALFSLHVYGSQGPQGRAVIEAEGGVWVYPLDEEREVSVRGPLGETRLRIEKGEARVEDSPCRDKLCVSQGAVSRNGSWAACLPNRIFLRVEAASPQGGGKDTEGEVDAFSY